MFTAPTTSTAVDEKLPLVEGSLLPPSESVRRQKLWKFLTIFFVLLCVRGILMHLQLRALTRHNVPVETTPPPDNCPQVEPILPDLVTLPLTMMDENLKSPEFREDSVKRMQGAVRIPSESYDDMGEVGEDDRWNIFFNVSSYLHETFPLISKHLRLDKINTHGLLYTWEGTDPSFKPTVLMAHQDVVPVANATRGEWTHDAFGGFYDGTYVWGRGSSDCKNSLIGIMEAVEELLKANFKPKRTVLLSFGFSEEILGTQGALHLSQAILDRYSRHGAAIIVDEGAGISSLYGTTIAQPGVAEKGFVDIEVIVRMPGGHSSIPVPHTGIGVAAELITLIESKPYTPKIYPQNPILKLMQCAKSHGPSFPPSLKKPLEQNDLDTLATLIADSSLMAKYLITTSQAIDLISGGVKVNALPERTTFTINHRINIGESTSQIQSHLQSLADPIAKKHNLTLVSFPSISTSDTETPQSITLKIEGEPLEPAPVTPTIINPHSISPYYVLAGTTRALYKDIIVAPSLMTGNTDTKFYWDVSEHIFRYNPGWDAERQDNIFEGIHTVNEKMNMVAHVKLVQWYSLFIRNMDEAVMD